MSQAQRTQTSAMQAGSKSGQEQATVDGTGPRLTLAVAVSAWLAWVVFLAVMALRT